MNATSKYRNAAINVARWPTFQKLSLFIVLGEAMIAPSAVKSIVVMCRPLSRKRKKAVAMLARLRDRDGDFA
ncbi:MAG: hypothetical protein ACRYG4_12860 [Janthinobacterium lividum]